MLPLPPARCRMLSHGYRELMILGFLSITLVLMMEFHLLEKMHVSYKEILVFEFAHLANLRPRPSVRFMN